MSEYSKRVGRFWDEFRLYSALLELTYRCNLNCSFCYNDLGLKGIGMEREDWLRLLEELADLGCLHLAISGGEPLASPDFFAVGRRARELQFVVRVKSNGHALRGALLQRLCEEVDPYLVEVSLHGAQAETHDRQTRVPGSFERLMRNLDEMRAAGLRVQLNSTLTIWNEREVEEMFAIADRLGVRLQFDPEVTPRDNGDRTPLELQASLSGLQRLYEVEAERARMRSKLGTGSEGGSKVSAEAEENNFREVVRQGDTLAVPGLAGRYCGAGSGAIAVDPFGNVYPCVQWRRPLGNLHRQKLHEIWNSSGETGRVRDLGSKIAARLAKEEPELMSFCPGIAEQLTGDPSAIYSAARERRELVRALRAGYEPTRTHGRLPVVP